uniref:Uncharacterized protein n=1 Tax=Anguilla anguilla TaxID=7936 RepID=A0A0E9P974_ANGAN
MIYRLMFAQFSFFHKAPCFIVVVSRYHC